MRRRWKVIVPLAAVLLGVGAWLVFGVFAFHLHFIDDEVDEPAPAFASATATTASTAPLTATTTPTTIRGTFVSRSHTTTGTASVLSDGAGRRVLRLENFRTDNGPDIDVYLSSAPADAPAGRFDEDFVSLGDIKGNVGNQNYDIPAGVDLEKYRTVVIWCVRFDVAFGVASLQSA